MPEREDIDALKTELAELRKRLSPSAASAAEIAKFFREKIVPLNSVCLLPDGKWYSREELMVKLGIDPSISPEAWLCGAGCGSNRAAALVPRESTVGRPIG